MGSTIRKVEILGDASKYDVCASMASPRIPTTNKRIGSPVAAGICHAFAPDGRCISLFKVLFTNNCSYDCNYCSNSCERKKRSTMFKPKELARVFMGLYIRNYVEGLFLSSGIWKDADRTTHKILECISEIRNKYRFRGYIHIKILPGTSNELIKQVMEIADRVSLNIEVPTASHLSEVSSTKDYVNDILRCQKNIRDFIRKGLTPAGHTTQFVLADWGGTDKEIVQRLDWEYRNVDLKRGYFKAFNPIEGTKFANIQAESAMREVQLYRTDWLMRKYEIDKKEILTVMNEKDMIDLDKDPKVLLAMNSDLFPLDINEANYNELIRVPGIGEVTAKRIINLRKIRKKLNSFSELQQLGGVVRRARPFLIINGKKSTNLKNLKTIMKI